MKKLLCLLMVLSAPALAQSRGGTDEWSMNLFAIGPRNYAFEGGATARNDGGAGVGLTVTHNLNDYFALGLEGSLSTFNYRATVVSSMAGSFSTDGNMESAALKAHLTWNLLARPLTPFLTASAGVIFLDPDQAGDPPANACWNYPWYGEVCSDKTPKNTLTRLTYGVGAGLRYELPRKQGYVRALLGAEWIDFHEALSPVGYVTLRADFGLSF
jgi:outer membrane protein with beta-barrel domain